MIRKPLDNVIKHMHELIEMRSDLHWHFRMNSKCFRAIEKHIEVTSRKEQECAFFDHSLGLPLWWPRGSGPVDFVDASVYAPDYSKTPPKEASVFRVRIRVKYYDDESDIERECEYWFDVPVDLELKFTQKKFDAWVRKLLKAKKAEREKDEKEKLRELMKKYPDEVKKRK